MKEQGRTDRSTVENKLEELLSDLLSKSIPISVTAPNYNVTVASMIGHHLSSSRFSLSLLLLALTILPLP